MFIFKAIFSMGMLLADAPIPNVTQNLAARTRESSRESPIVNRSIFLILTDLRSTIPGALTRPGGQVLSDVGYVMDAEGWVSVERPKKEAEASGADERDPSIWVMFAKQIGAEKFLLSFPDEPTYRYMNGNGEEMEVMTAVGGIEHRLQVWNEKFESAERMLKLRLERLEAAAVIEQKSDENSAELLVWKDGFWLHEKIIKTDRHTFFLQTKSPSIERDSHRAFVQSFDLEIDPKI